MVYFPFYSSNTKIGIILKHIFELHQIWLTTLVRKIRVMENGYCLVAYDVNFPLSIGFLHFYIIQYIYILYIICHARYLFEIFFYFHFFDIWKNRIFFVLAVNLIGFMYRFREVEKIYQSIWKSLFFCFLSSRLHNTQIHWKLFTSW